MDETKNLSATENVQPPVEGSSDSSDETKDLSGTEGAQPPASKSPSKKACRSPGWSGSSMLRQPLTYAIGYRQHKSRHE
jgi:hypothetical protein